MTTPTQYRALIVDDEYAVRQATMRALTQAGFRCEPASNGREALQLTQSESFDAVVTDLRMPEANGHTLASTLLERPNRPVVMVLTGVTEPKLVNDLKVRGIDGVYFKPTDYRQLAEDMRACVERRLGRAKPAGKAQTKDQAGAPPAAEVHDGVSAERIRELTEQVVQLAKNLPTPPKDYDTWRAASDDNFDGPQLAAAMTRDLPLTSAVLQTVNGMSFKSTKTISELSDKVESLTAAKETRGLALVFCFGGGVLLGWLLSVLSGWLMH